MRGASRVRVVSIVDVVERYRQESTCCGGWVILKKCTAYFRLDVMGFFFFFSVTFSGSVGCRSQPPSVFYQKAKGTLCFFRQSKDSERKQNKKLPICTYGRHWQLAGGRKTVYCLRLGPASDEMVDVTLT